MNSLTRPICKGEVMTSAEIAVIEKIKSNFSGADIRCISIRNKDRAVCLFGEKNIKNILARHESVYAIRRSIKAIIEAKTEYSDMCAQLRVYPDTRLFPQGEMRCGQIAICDIHDMDEIFDSYKTCAMTRDGTLFIGANSIEEAYKQFEIANLIASICANARLLGKSLSVLERRHIALYKLNVTLPLMEELDMSKQCGEDEAREGLASVISKLYNEHLFLDSNGAASVRISENSFLITASDKERSQVTPDDLVMIHNGRREPGKHPSNSAALHKMIYDANPHINSIIISHPRYSMAFSACSCDIELDDKAIDIVKNIKRYPFGATVMQPTLFTNGITPDVNAYLIENDCLVCFGDSPDSAAQITREVERCAAEKITPIEEDQ